MLTEHLKKVVYQVYVKMQIFLPYTIIKEKKSKTTNNRPVSLTCLPSRLCEKKVRDNIMKHMNDNNLFSTCQYGFRKKRSCVLQLLDVLDDWSKYYDESKQIDNL